MKQPLILIGGGGHCKSCIDVIEAEGKYAIEGILDTTDKIGTTILGYPVLADDSQIDAFVEKGCSFLVTIGQIKSSALRRRLYGALVEKSARIATVISPTAIVSRHAQVGAGTIVMHRAHVNAGAKVGENVILNSGCLVEHDAVVGSHVHISTHTVLNGAVAVQDNCFIGSSTVVAQEVTIAPDTVVGAGSVIISDILTPGVYAGCPSKRIK